MNRNQIEAIYRKVVCDLKLDKAPVETFDDIDSMWSEIIDLNKTKECYGDENTAIASLSRMYIIEYARLSMAVNSGIQGPHIQMLSKYLILSIANTALAIYKLAFDGFDYQCKVLVRNLYELCMTLLNVIIDPEKREALFESAQNEDEKLVWYKHFSPKHLQETLKKYEESLGGEGVDEWHKRIYAHFSSYAHNDFMSFFTYSNANPLRDETIYPNLCGSFVTRAEILLNDMNGILFYTGMVFMNLMVNPEIDVDKKVLCGDVDATSVEGQLWNEASFLEMVNRAVFLEVYAEEHPYKDSYMEE